MTQLRIGSTQFCLGRNFNNPNFPGTKVTGLTVEELLAFANQGLEDGTAVLEDGYMPACKHLWIRNPEASTTRAGVAKMTAENMQFLKTGYEARREGELPVLGRWFKGLEAPRAEWLDLILYSREHLQGEEAGKSAEEQDIPDAEWGLVAVNAELLRMETPLDPTTQLRNALGPAEGGSGRALDRGAYMRAVEYWSSHAVVR